MREKIFNPDRSKTLKKLRSLGIEPYPYSYPVDTNIHDVLANFEHYKSKNVTLAGRILSIREHGKTVFMHIRDFTGDIQIYLRKDTLESVHKGKTNLWELIKYVDITDIIGVKGEIFQTKTGEITVWGKDFDLLSKALYPIPFGKQKGEKKWYAGSDPEIKYKERYTYWNIYPEERERIGKRTQIINMIREFMNSRGFLEVQTPTIEMVYGGAEARPFETRIWALDGAKAFLRISPELYLKRYIVGGFPKVYTICQNFRNEGIDHSHNPEFTMMEWYESYTDYEYQMKQFEELVSTIAKNICESTKIIYQGTEIDFSPPWNRISMLDAIKEIGGFDVEKASDAEIKDWYMVNEVEILEPYNRGLAIAEIFERLCQDKMVQPVFVIDHPQETSPLCKAKRGKLGLIERFEPIVCGMEIGNAYSELTDPVEQYENFEEQRKLREKEEVEHHPWIWIS